MPESVAQQLEELKKQGLLRNLKTISKVSGNKITIDGKEYINFSSNNYLGLADHPLVKEKAKKAIDEFGFGSGASRLISGTSLLHQKLEEKLADFKHKEAGLVFTSGYQANIGIISSLTDEKDTIIIDRLNHASIIDACKFSRARLQVYPHKDLATLEKIIKRSDKFKKRLIITDLVFSMDGDIAPIEEIVRLAKKHNALTMTDEAHATGVLEAKDYGVDIVMGTLSKALGSLGGFVCGSKSLIDFLINKARSFIYTTALPPSACAAAIAALEVIENEPEILNNLRMNSRLLREKIKNCRINATVLQSGTENLFSGSTPIIPILIGDADKTMAASKTLFEHGFFVSGIRPPTVPRGQSRLRLVVNALHTRQEIEGLINALEEI